MPPNDTKGTNSHKYCVMVIIGGQPISIPLSPCPLFCFFGVADNFNLWAKKSKRGEKGSIEINLPPSNINDTNRLNFCAICTVGGRSISISPLPPFHRILCFFLGRGVIRRFCLRSLHGGYSCISGSTTLASAVNYFINNGMGPSHCMW